jgi:hypothetical protein
VVAEPAVEIESGTEAPKESWMDKTGGVVSKPVGLAASVNDWTVDDFNKYATARNSVGQKAGQALVSMAVPFGGIASKIRERYLERNVPREMASMIESGKDLQGNPLSSAQLDRLKESYSRINSEPLSAGRGVSGIANAILQETGLVKPRPAATEKAAKQQARAQNDGLINRALDFITGEQKSRKTPNTSSSGQNTSSSGQNTSSSGQKESSGIIGKRSGSSGSSDTARKGNTSKGGSGSVSMSANKSSSSANKSSSGSKNNKKK